MKTNDALSMKPEVITLANRNKLKIGGSIVLSGNSFSVAGVDLDAYDKPIRYNVTTEDGEECDFRPQDLIGGHYYSN